MANLEKIKENVSLENIIASAIQIQGVKVDRDSFLRKQFKDESDELMNTIVEKGPVEANYSRDTLKKMAKALIQKRAVASSAASFVAGLPGGPAMAATIPTDMLQFYAVVLRLAQEIAYLYGEPDLWSNNILDKERVTNQLILYCGVMFGATGAAQTVRVLSSSISKQVMKKLPQKALTKTFYYPIVKQIAKACGVKMTKEIFAKGVSKAVPIVGGVVSGGITYASMMPMANRLVKTFDNMHFEYTENDFNNDYEVINAEIV